jgi:hypothetical protein
MDEQKINVECDNIFNKDSEIIAKTAIRMALGCDNEYLQRLLENKIRGKKKKYKSIPIKELVYKKNYSSVEKTLQDEIDNVQNNSSGILDSDNKQITIPQDISKWIINTILNEKLQYRKVLENSDKWKIINGILAITLPIITPIITSLIQYYFTCNCNSSSN